MKHDHINLHEYLELRTNISCRFIDIQDKRIKDRSLGDGRGLGPFRVGISKELKVWMIENHIPLEDKSYHENLLVKTMKYYLLFFLNSLRPWLAKHMPENLRKYARLILRR